MARAGRRPYRGRRSVDARAATSSADPRVVRHLWSDLSIRVAEGDDRAYAAVCGEVDLDCADTMEHVLADCIGPAPRDLDVDLSGVGFLDCAGLNALLRVQGRARAAGAEMFLTGISPAVARILELTRCSEAFPAAPSPLPAAAPPVPPPPTEPAARPA